MVKDWIITHPIGTTQGRPRHDLWTKLLIQDTVSHCARVLIAQNSSRRRPWAGDTDAKKKFGRRQCVHPSDDSEKGCELAVTEHPDVILMDLEMPDADCWEVVRRLKKDAHTGHIPIIGMSAYALDSEREKAIASGCDEFDAKPIDFESLVATIRRLVANPK